MVKSYIKHPTEGVPIETLEYGKINVPNNPIIPFIEGDGVGPEISQSMIKTIDEVVKKTYTDERKITWMEIYAGEKANLNMEEIHGFQKKLLIVLINIRLQLKVH